MKLYVFDDYVLGAEAEDGRVADITDLIAADEGPLHRMSRLITDWNEISDAVGAAAAGRGDFDLSEITVRAPQPSPSAKVIAAPVNYTRHQQEMGGMDGVYAGTTVKTIETYSGFIKATSSVVGPDRAIELPFADRRVDHEAELGVIVGKRAKRVAASDALDYVFGYVPLLDITIRGEEDRSFRKSFDTFTPIGPAIVTADEVPDPDDLTVELTVNAEIRQRANTCDLIYGVARLIELYSGAMTLEPGDIIATGTPEGVGPIEPGDKVVLTVEHVGRLSMHVTAA